MTAPYKKSAIALQDEVAAEAYKKMFKMYAKLPLAEQNANSSDLEATKRLYHNQGRDALKSIVQMQKVFKALGAPPVAPWEQRLPRLPHTPAHRNPNTVYEHIWRRCKRRKRRRRPHRLCRPLFPLSMDQQTTTTMMGISQYATQMGSW